MKINKYNPSLIEPKWRAVWEKEKIYSPNLDKAKKPFYNLMMFPYPSAEGLHAGNMYAFTGADIYGRYQRMKGNDVFEPIGLDGFGIHSENYALKVGRHPMDQAKISEKNFYRQLRQTGNSYDWEAKFETYDPRYYKWTQWIFIQMFKKGLAYRKKAQVNFCPSCKTVLADEQVISGLCERCSSVVEKKDLEQWFFRITKYANRLLENLEKIDWSEKVKIAQREWIGRSEGALIKFRIAGPAARSSRSMSSVGTLPAGTQRDALRSRHPQYIDVFTTRPDTLFGATFLVLSPNHPFVASILAEKFEATRSHLAKLEEIKKYIEESKKKTEIEKRAQEKDKTGAFSGLYAINPVNNEKIPIWIADYVLMDYGTGALFGDAHDQRDFSFAKKYGIPLKPTLKTGDGKKDKRILNLEECFTGYGILLDSGQFSGLTSQEAIRKITEWLDQKGSGGKQTTYHLRDWLISRQRYWGPPIPMIYCKECARLPSPEGEVNGGQGWQPVPEKDLPVLLPKVSDWKPKGTGKSPLATVESFVNTACPNCKNPAKRETDVSDTFLDSAWYFFRYPSLRSARSGQVPFDPEITKKWLPVNMYIGGAEHSVLHLLYTRFIAMFFKDLGLVSFEEPFKRFYAHGLLIREGAKMSKSKGNVVVPDKYIQKFGVDTMRCYLMFLGPFSQGGDFRDTGMEGMFKFLNRVWNLVSSKKILRDGKVDLYLQKLTGEITEEIENLRYNTAISRLMMYCNFLVKKDTSGHEIFKSEIANFVKMISPFTPHLAEEMWEVLGQKSSVHIQIWPNVDKEQLKKSYGFTIAIQINGKTRSTMDSEVSLSKEESERKASIIAEKYLKGKKIAKTIYVEGKVINFVID